MRAKQHYLKGQLDDSISDANECIQLVQNDLDQRKILGEAYRNIGLCFFLKGKMQECVELARRGAEHHSLHQ